MRGLLLLLLAACLAPTSTFQIPIHRTTTSSRTSRLSDVPPSVGLQAPLPSLSTLPLSSPLSFSKFLTLQEKRVVVTLRYTGGCGLRPFFLTAAQSIKDTNPDVLIEKTILPVAAGKTFEILVDSKVVVDGKLKSLVVGTPVSVFLKSLEIDVAIGKARRKRRPKTVYFGHNGGGGGM